MVLVTPLVLAIGFIVIFLALDYFSEVFGVFFLSVVFLYAVANVPMAERQALFYSVMTVIVLVLTLVRRSGISYLSSDNGSVFGERASGKWWYLINVGLGVVIFMVMYFIQVFKGAGSILGVPVLSGTTATGMSLVLISLLGPVENRFFIGIFEMLLVLGKKIPFGVLLVPLSPVLAAGVFGLYHGYVFQAQAILIGWAVGLFLGWIIIYKLLKRTTSIDVAHMLWNLAVTIKKVV